MKVLLHKLDRENIMPGRDRRMSGENSGCPNLLDSFLKSQHPALPPPWHVSSIMKAAWPSLACQMDWIDAQSPQDTHTANTQNNLLLNTQLAVCYVKAGRQLTVLR